jgi:hypothetical protein
MGAQTDSLDWRDRKVREWLLLLLRFAITWEPSDESAAHAMADELDSLGAEWRPFAPSFFRRTSSEVCEAMRDPANEAKRVVLRRHLGRIVDLPLRRAFQAALALQEKPAQTAPRTSVKNKKQKERKDLWRGLAKK